jgi:hypothetical protein
MFGAITLWNCHVMWQSRCVTSRYVAAPWRVLFLNYFFCFYPSCVVFVLFPARRSPLISPCLAPAAHPLPLLAFSATWVVHLTLTLTQLCLTLLAPMDNVWQHNLGYMSLSASWQSLSLSIKLYPTHYKSLAELRSHSSDRRYLHPTEPWAHTAYAILLPPFSFNS